MRGEAATGTQHRRKTGAGVCGQVTHRGTRRPLRGHSWAIISKLEGPPRVEGGRDGQEGRGPGVSYLRVDHLGGGLGGGLGRLEGHGSWVAPGEGVRG